MRYKGKKEGKRAKATKTATVPAVVMEIRGDVGAEAAIL